MSQHTLEWKDSNGTHTLTLPFFCTQQSRGTPRTLIIGIHGYGDNARNFVELAQDFRFADVMWVCPQGPTEVPRSMGGAEWYELFGDPRDDVERARRGIEEVLRKVSKETQIPLTHTFFLGFSQGAFMALHTALRLGEPLGGVIAISGYLAQTLRIPPLTEMQKNMPIFLGHGTQDQVVMPHMHFEAADALDVLGFKKVTRKMYNVSHSMCLEEIRDIEKFIEANR